MAKRYQSVGAFQQALTQKLQAEVARTQVDANTLRLRLVVQRFLARIFTSPSAPWLLKGGFAMELRLGKKARATRDIDLMIGLGVMTVPPTPMGIRDLLAEELATDLGDRFTFRLGEPEGLANPPQGGAELRCEAILQGKLFRNFHVDVGCGDVVDEPHDELVLAPLIPMAEFDTAKVKIISAFQQFAEKIHAYTLVWGERQNTRVKDLIDLVLLLEVVTSNPMRLRHAVTRTFTTRNKQAVPIRLEPPPETWESEFRRIAQQVGLHTESVTEAFAMVSAFWETHFIGS